MQIGLFLSILSTSFLIKRELYRFNSFKKEQVTRQKLYLIARVLVYFQSILNLFPKKNSILCFTPYHQVN